MESEMLNENEKRAEQMEKVDNIQEKFVCIHGPRV